MWNPFVLSPSAALRRALSKHGRLPQAHPCAEHSKILSPLRVAQGERDFGILNCRFWDQWVVTALIRPYSLCGIELYFMCRIIIGTFLFAATDYPASGCSAPRFGDNGMLSFVMPIIVKRNHYPVFYAIQLVSARGI